MLKTQLKEAAMMVSNGFLSDQIWFQQPEMDRLIGKLLLVRNLA